MGNESELPDLNQQLVFKPNFCVFKLTAIQWYIFWNFIRESHANINNEEQKFLSEFGLSKSTITETIDRAQLRQNPNLYNFIGFQ